MSQLSKGSRRQSNWFGKGQLPRPQLAAAAALVVVVVVDVVVDMDDVAIGY